MGFIRTIARLVGAAPVLEGQHAGGVLYSYWEQFANGRVLLAVPPRDRHGRDPDQR